MGRLKFTFVVLLLICSNLLIGQGTANKVRDEADRYFKAQEYSKAIQLYERLSLMNSNNTDFNKNLGISYFFSNRLQEAETSLTKYYNGHKEDLDAVYYLACAAHHELKFDLAIDFYKYFLSRSKPSNPLYKSVIGDIKRCGVAKKIKYQEELAISENSGPKVNSPADEINPTWSPNHNGRIYFTANQEIDTTDRLDNLMSKVSDDYNMFGSEIQIDNGLLSYAYPLNEALNTPEVEQIYGFNENGKLLYFGRGQSLNSLSLYTEDLTILDDESPSINKFDAHFGNDPMLIDLYPFSDSVLIFSSIKPEGFGGYDLYYVEFKDGRWKDPVNFGDKINSEFDERAPFLSKDGRTLYFSSNNFQSVGGYDIFSAYYLDKDMEWTNVQNMGFPINSPGHELFFKLGFDGQKSLFSSDRKSGFGGYDLYTGFFKSIRTEQNTAALPDVFFKVPEFKLNSQEYQDEVLANKITALNIEPLYYTSDDNVLQPKNKQQLDLLVEIGKRFPTTIFNFLINSESSVSPEIELYFGIKRSELISNYMISKGISGNRVNLQSVGSLYPIAKNVLDGRPSISGQNLNRRVEISINNIDSLPLKITYKQPFVSDLLKTSDGSKFKRRINGLSYRVQIVSLKQMYNGDIYSLSPDLLIESQGGSGNYRYMTGLFPTFADAVDFQTILIKNGLKDAFIVPYIDNVRLTKSTISESMMNKYPDLRKYYLN